MASTGVTRNKQERLPKKQLSREIKKSHVGSSSITVGKEASKHSKCLFVYVKMCSLGLCLGKITDCKAGGGALWGSNVS